MGAGLDTFSRRKPEAAAPMQVFEVDQEPTLVWKKKRYQELGWQVPQNLHFVSVDFESGSWQKALLSAGFDRLKPAFFACTGVSLYLTREAILATLRQVASLAPSTMIAMALYLPIELLEEEDRNLQSIAAQGAIKAGTPFKSFFSPTEAIGLAKEANFKSIELFDHHYLTKRYFMGRRDSLLPASGELFLVATA